MPQTLPARNIFDGTALPSTSTMKTALGQLRDYLAETLGPVGGVSSNGLKNRLINGSVKIDQRNSGAAQTFTAGAALAYCVDQWYGYATGANITGQRVAVGTLHRYRFTGAASNTGVGFGQRIEAANSMDLAGSTATLSIKASSSSLTALNWQLFYATTADTFGTLAAPTRTSIASGSFTINATEARYSTQITMPAGATTGLELVLTGGALLAAQTLTLGDLQLELGGVATSFEAQRPIALELALCQWFYRPAPLARFSGDVAGTQNVITSVSWPTMRVAPSLLGATYTQAGTTGAALSNINAAGSTFGANVTTAGSFDFSVTAGALSSVL